MGYDHVSKLHGNGTWISDLVSTVDNRTVTFDEKTLIRRQECPCDVFDRDCCMLLENIFFAEGKGLAIDDEALGILREAQPGKSGISDEAVFGLTGQGRINGLRGTYLALSGELATRFVEWLNARIQQQL